MEYHNSPLRKFVTQKDWIYVLCEAISSLPAKACILTQFSQFILWLKMAAAAPSDSATPRRACDLAPRNTKSEWFWDTLKDPKRPGKNKWLQYNEHFKEAKFGDISMYSQFFVESFANSMQFPHFSNLLRWNFPTPITQRCKSCRWVEGNDQPPDMDTAVIESLPCWKMGTATNYFQCMAVWL